MSTTKTVYRVKDGNEIILTTTDKVEAERQARSIRAIAAICGIAHCCKIETDEVERKVKDGEEKKSV